MIVQIANTDRATPSDIGDLFVRARDGSMIPLANLLSVDETVSPRELNYFGQRRAVTLTANLSDWSRRCRLPTAWDRPGPLP
ncbi:MAG: efflux RND transporter permease subunit [Candidatus Accumulibacter phosphatis]|nr:efflux RND transporter permease subunit [Candidatus Accumulibacter phosphatis]HNC19120.1 efflux RND transporter permease subunit [Accumulibacter sp.]